MARIGSFGERLDLNIKQGSTFRLIMIVRNPPSIDPITGEAVLGDPANITDCFVRAQIRRKALDPAVLATFAVAVIDAAGGRVEMVLTDEITAAIPAGEMLKDPLSAAVWDAEFEDSTGDVFPIRYGDVLILREVTRPI